jgi:hypothetical protein
VLRVRGSTPLGFVWIAGYLAATLGLVAAAAFRRKPVLLKGSSLLALTLLFVALSAAAAAGHARRSGTVLLPLVAFQLVAVGVAWAARGQWLVAGAGPAAVGATLERCLGMLCASFERAADGYVVPLADGPLRVALRPALGGATVVTFRGATGHRKAALLRTLLAKQFDPVVPRVKVGRRGE